MFISQKLVESIEHDADKITRRWLEDVRKRPETPTYHTFDPDELYRRAYLVYSQLGKWVSYETSKEEIASRCTALRVQRRREGFSLSEVIQALDPHRTPSLAQGPLRGILGHCPRSARGLRLGLEQPGGFIL